jgi:hypothetical protein
MKAILLRSGLFAFAALGAALVFVTGCGQDNPPAQTSPPPQTSGPPKKISKGPNIKLEEQGDKRRVLVSGEVCQRDGFLELVLTQTGKRMHEALLDADVDARDLYKALKDAGAKPGHPVQFEPKLRPAEGQTINVLVQYELDGKQHTVPVRSWLRNHDKKEVALEWLFTGSTIIPDQNDWTNKIMLAQVEGTLIGLGATAYEGSASALLDVKGGTGKHRDELEYEYYTERIPPKETKVTIILEPVGEYKPGK